jgi:hypothetical protein
VVAQIRQYGLTNSVWGLAMSTGRHSFKHNDAVRLIRVVEAAGKKITALTLQNGVVTVLVDGAHPDKANANPWDEVLKDDRDTAEVRSRIR